MRFDYIEMFFNPVRRQSENNGISLAQFEQKFSERVACV